jgi:integrase
MVKRTVGVRVEVRSRGVDEWLYLRGTFPPRPGSDRTQPYQQRIALRMRNTPDARRKAEAIAKKVSGQINLGEFRWQDWIEEEPAQKNQGDFRAAVKQHWWRNKDKSHLGHHTTWKLYSELLAKMPDDIDISEAGLTQWLGSITSNGQRIHGRTIARMMAKIYGLQADKIQCAVRTGIRPVNPRLLPSDAEIIAYHGSLRKEGWRWIFGMLAAYGLRPHEAIGLDMSRFPVIGVRATAKTGARVVTPLYPEWAEQWGLGDRILPKCLSNCDGLSNAQIGEKVRYKFNRKPLDFPAYNLRHAFARRCVEFGLGIDLASKLMGHSPEIHRVVYRAWVGDDPFLNAVDRIVGRGDRPLPPN